MRERAKWLKALTLVVALAAMVPLDLASAQPHGRAVGHQEGRGRDRAEQRREERREYRRGDRDNDRNNNRGRGYGRPSAPYAYPPTYYPAPAPTRPAYTAPPYGYAPPPPSYPGNSLGPGWGQQQDEARRGVRQGGLMPLGRVMTIIRRDTPGRLLDAGLEPGPNGRPAYRVRWAAAGGRRIDFIVDAASGAIIGRSY